MSKKRGLSLEEKRRRLQDLYLEEVTVFILKELEKLAAKRKGIVLQSVKDVNQSLIDDNLVCMDKIGTSNYYWSFASQGFAVRQKRIDSLKEQLEAAEQAKADSLAEAEKLREARGSGKEREALEARYAELRATNKSQREELTNFAELDPDVLEQLRADAHIAHEAANRWTDNILMLCSYVQKNFPSINIADFRKNYGITEDMDYLE